MIKRILLSLSCLLVIAITHSAYAQEKVSNQTITADMFQQLEQVVRGKQQPVVSSGAQKTQNSDKPLRVVSHKLTKNNIQSGNKNVIIFEKKNSNTKLIRTKKLENQKISKGQLAQLKAALGREN